MTDVRTPAPGRLDALDALRGVAIVLVVLSHSWTLWSFETVDKHAWARAIFRNGDAAVSVFLVASGFLTYRTLLGQGSDQVRLDVALLRRLVRVAPALWLMLAAVAVVAAVDPSDETRWVDNRRSALRAVTYTYNWFVEDHLLQARYDLGHLWYLSVDMQAFVMMGLLVYALRRRRVGLVLALTGCYLLGVWWRFHVTGTEPTLTVLVRTTARMDAFVIGLLAAAVVALLERHRLVDQKAARRTAAVALVGLVPLFYWCAGDPLGDGDQDFLTWGGTFLGLDLALLMGAIALAGPRLAAPGIGRRMLVALGGASLLIYVWHYPVFAFVERHTHGWQQWSRVVVALVAVLAICVAADLLVERRVREVLGSPRWRALDDGLLGWVAAAFVDRVSSRGSATGGHAPARGERSRPRSRDDA